ncbi:hypothetical protein GBA52_007402 [Prunus armeniaca]|nr:hypothetical protein GBA52_007402 [Prunus armeniaca]
MADQKDQHQQQQQPHGSKREEEEVITTFSPSIFSPKSFPRRRRIKYCGIVIALVLLQIVVLGVLCLTVFRFKDPNIKLAAISVENFSTALGTSTAINMTLRAEIKVKNQNWGKLKYDESVLVLSHEGLTVGEGTIPKGSIKMRHSKQVSVSVEAKLDGRSSSSSDISSGVLNLKSYAKLSGKVSMVGLVKKRRSGEMNCSLTISLARQAIQDFHCQ